MDINKQKGESGLIDEITVSWKKPIGKDNTIILNHSSLISVKLMADMQRPKKMEEFFECIA